MRSHYSVLFLIVTVLLSLRPVLRAAAQDDCADLVLPRLAQGVTARAAFNDGIGVVLRDAPNTQEGQSTVLDNLPEGMIFTVIGTGPVCKDGFLWWQVRLPDGREGYLAEGGGRSAAYFVEPWEVGRDLFLPDAANPNQLNRFFVDTRGNVQARAPLALTPQGGAVAALWQPPEVFTTNAALADRQINCAGAIPPHLAGVTDVGGLAFEDNARTFYPAPDGSKVLVLRDFLLDLPTCAGANEKYGTTQVSVVSAAGEQAAFPFSQHADPPPSTHCQPQVGVALDQPTKVMAAAWSQDARYAALEVRYLRNSQQFPCAFYHAFVLDTATMTVTHAGEGRRLGWGQGGRRLRYIALERSDPNAEGVQRMFSVLPDGSDRLEIFLPSGATWLPGAMDLANTRLPWTENGDKLLVCNGRVYNCGETLTFRLVDSGFEATPIITPDQTQLGSSLAAVHYVAGDTQLLWLSTAGRLFLQPIKGENAGRWSEAAIELIGDSPIVEVLPLPTGVGAVLRLSDGRYFYLDVLANVARPIEDLGQ